MLGTAAFAQTHQPFVTADPALAHENLGATAQPGKETTKVAMAASQRELQIRPEHTVLPIATVLRLKLDRSVSTASAKPGERFTATLTRPVEVSGRIVVPAGASVNCTIEKAHGARRFKGKPLIYIKAHSMRMANGEEINFAATVVDTSNPRQLNVDQEGRVRGASPNPMNKVETGALAGVGAVAGTVIAGPYGLLFGAASGAAIAAGHIAVKHRDLTLPAGTELILELDAPAAISRPQMGGMQ
ncbi:MAG: hypothetical protein CXZ00_02015 [Acidobacteria bacterium]|nr:MAG: hypothetical protein CXZ00_02015 [Acidobacteriota bacterium]